MTPVIATLGLLFGHTARTAGRDVVAAATMSATTFAGGAQFAALAVVQGGGTLLAAPDGAWAAAVAFHSLMHLPRLRVTDAPRELRQVLRPGGRLLVAFHVGADVRRVETLWNVAVILAFVFFTPDEMEGYLRQAGFVVESRVERDPYPEVESATRRCPLSARV